MVLLQKTNMNTTTEKTPPAVGKPDKAVTVTVNTKPVTFADHKASGLEIKRTAIKQEVAIQEDFALFEVKGKGIPLKPVLDGEEVTLHPNQEFRALAPDDNS
jgi:hypothetical protein